MSLYTVILYDDARNRSLRVWAETSERAARVAAAALGCGEFDERLAVWYVITRPGMNPGIVTDAKGKVA